MRDLSVASITWESRNAGSVASGGVTKTFTYDTENRVKTIAYSSGGSSDTFKYNGDGQRVEKVENGTTTRFVYDGSTVIAETNGSGTITNYFLPGIGWVAGTTQRYYRENGLGSNVTTMTSSGSVDSRTEYDAYGVEYNVSSGTKSQFRFAGKHGYYTDDRSGLQLLGARYYMPALGRFLTQDPIGHEAGLNLYAYCNNNPLSKVDPTGLAEKILQNSAAYKLIHRQIDALASEGYATDAAALRKIPFYLANDNEVAGNDGNPGILGALDGRILISRTMLDRLAGKFPERLSLNDTEAFKGTLLHELKHYRQFAQGAKSGDLSLEAAAYDVGAKYWQTRLKFAQKTKNDLLVKVATSLAAWSQNNSSSFERTYGRWKKGK